MSIVRTTCSTCDKPLFWGEDATPECHDCREVRETAASAPEIRMGAPALNDAVLTLTEARALLN